MSQLCPVGTVKWFNARKGYGFLLEESTGEEIFVHHSAIRAVGYRKLEKGAMVKFQKVHSPKGVRAVEVEPLKPSGENAEKLAASN